MDVERRDNPTEKTVLIGMIVNKRVLATISARWGEGDMFSSRWANLVGNFAVKYYQKYGKAPGRAIQGSVDRWSMAQGRDEETVKLLQRFLEELSSEYDRNGTGPSPDYILDEANQCFQKNRIRELRDVLGSDLASGDVRKAAKHIRDFTNVEIGEDEVITPFESHTIWEAAMTHRSNALFRFNQEALDKFFENVLERDGFIAFQGMEKVGKSFWILDLCHRGFVQGLNVAFIQAGDLSRNQVMERIIARVCRRPVRPDEKMLYPVKLEPGNYIEHEEKVYPTGMKWGVDVDKDYVKKLGKRYRPDGFRLIVRPNYGINVPGIEAILQNWKVKDRWVPDIIGIDYPDIMAPIDPKADKRERINDTWMALRSLSQKWHCLVITATQADANTYGQFLQSRSNFSEDHRKYAHVTAMIAINQRDEDKKVGTYRLNFLAGRNLQFPESTYVTTAGCLGVANPCILSTFG